MHVVVPPLLVYGEGMLPPLPVAGELKEKLQRVQPQDEDVAVSHLLEEGDPADQILRVAQEGGYDLVVMGTHGRTGLGRLLMGSVAEKVMRKAPCPVLVAKAPQPRKFAKRAAAAPASR
jgi:nucleotide-binding universal stress UspA family protein